jgi:hypothetical protein
MVNDWPRYAAKVEMIEHIVAAISQKMRDSQTPSIVNGFFLLSALVLRNR